MATEEKKKTLSKKGVLATCLFVIVLICALLGMDVKNNTILQLADSYLSGDIVENAANSAEKVKNVITPLKALAGGASGVSLNMSSFKDISSLTTALSSLNELKAAYEGLKSDSGIQSLFGSTEKVSSADLNSLSKQVSEESNFVDKSIDLYSFLINNQENISYSDTGDLVVSDSIKSIFQPLLNDWISAKGEVGAGE